MATAAPPSATLRGATAADVPGILAIVNREIREGTALWDVAEKEPAEMEAWFAERTAGGWPVIVAVDAEGARALLFLSFYILFFSSYLLIFFPGGVTS
jgi:L-amino acid N-acyltransferase YncA